MNDPAPGSVELLPHLGLLRFTGPDALSFLQGQLSNDTRLLTQGRALLAAYSSPQGRVLAIIYLLPHSSGTLAILPRDLLEATLQRLRKFVMRAKVVIEDVSGSLALLGAYEATALQPLGLNFSDADRAYREQEGVGAVRVVHDAHRFWVVGAREKFMPLVFQADAGRAEAAWRLADVRAGLPQVYAATREAFVAQMLNLDLLEGISFSKGCYTGQEIIARTQHLGRIKRRMFHLALPNDSWSIGQTIRLSDGRQGRIAELARGREGPEALAVLNLEGSGESDAEGASGTAPIHAKEMPLPYSLGATSQ